VDSDVELAEAWQAPLVDSDVELEEAWQLRAPPSRGRRGPAAAAALLVLACAALLLSRARPASLLPGRVRAATGLVLVEEVPADPCAGFAFLNMTTVVHNNLGGKGPDSGAEGIVFRGVDQGRGETNREILLIVNASGDYQPNSARQNGFNGAYMTINLRGGTHVQLHMRVVDAFTGQPMTLPKQEMTFFDLDTGDNGQNTEYIKIRGYTSATLTTNTELRRTEEDGFTRFTASTVGTGDDNPHDPLALTIQQKNRAVTLEFQPLGELDAELGCSAGPHPRYFTFVGRPSLVCATTTDGAGDDTSLSTTDSSGNPAPTPTTTESCLFTIPIINWCCPKPSWWPF